MPKETERLITVTNFMSKSIEQQHNDIIERFKSTYTLLKNIAKHVDYTYPKTFINDFGHDEYFIHYDPSQSQSSITDTGEDELNAIFNDSCPMIVDKSDDEEEHIQVNVFHDNNVPVQQTTNQTVVRQETHALTLAQKHEKLIADRAAEKVRARVKKIYDLLDKLYQDIKQLEDDYRVSTMVAITNMRKEIPGYETLYNDALTIFNINGRFSECSSLCHSVLDRICTDPQFSKGSQALEHEFNLTMQFRIDVSTKIIDYEYCCGVKMNVIADKSELYCEVCNHNLDLKGMVFSDAQFYCQDSKKSRHGKYERQRNFHTWVDHIWAKDGFVIPDEMRVKLDRYLNREKLGKFGSAQLITIRHVREFLEENRYSKFNRNGASILSQTCGVYPPTFTSEEFSVLSTYYSKILLVLSDFKENNNQDMYNNPYKAVTRTKTENTSYCPYFVSKIVEARWPGDVDKQRIQAYIFHKKPETICKLDNKWLYLCKYLGFTFIPTLITKGAEKPYEAYRKALEYKKKIGCTTESVNYISFTL
jgi:hypothetical protein